MRRVSAAWRVSCGSTLAALKSSSTVPLAPIHRLRSTHKFSVSRTGSPLEVPKALETNFSPLLAPLSLLRQRDMICACSCVERTLQYRLLRRTWLHTRTVCFICPSTEGGAHADWSFYSLHDMASRFVPTTNTASSNYFATTGPYGSTTRVLEVAQRRRWHRDCSRNARRVHSR